MLANEASRANDKGASFKPRDLGRAQPRGVCCFLLSVPLRSLHEASVVATVTLCVGLSDLRTRSRSSVRWLAPHEGRVECRCTKLAVRRLANGHKFPLYSRGNPVRASQAGKLFMNHAHLSP